jgi:DNA-binding MarR family transcriptional regulator
MNLKQTVDYYIKSSWHSIARMYNQIASENELSQTIGYVLINVPKEGVPATQIAPLMGMEPTSLSRLLKTMEENRLIYRQKDLVDKRVVKIFLTEKGIEKRKISKKIILDFNEKIEKNIPAEKLECFVSVLGQICELAKKE